MHIFIYTITISFFHLHIFGDHFYVCIYIDIRTYIYTYISLYINNLQKLYINYVNKFIFFYVKFMYKCSYEQQFVIFENILICLFEEKFNFIFLLY